MACVAGKRPVPEVARPSTSRRARPAVVQGPGDSLGEEREGGQVADAEVGLGRADHGHSGVHGPPGSRSSRRAPAGATAVRARGPRTSTVCSTVTREPSTTVTRPAAAHGLSGEHRPCETEVQAAQDTGRAEPVEELFGEQCPEDLSVHDGGGQASGVGVRGVVVQPVPVPGGARVGDQSGERERPLQGWHDGPGQQLGSGHRGSSGDSETCRTVSSFSASGVPYWSV